MAETSERREYSGAALSSFILGLSDSQAIIDKILADAGVDAIDPEAWYDYDWAIDLFVRIEDELGPGAVNKVGRSMIEVATYPPEIDNIKALLSGLGYWFSLNARGPGVGTITCEWEDEHGALIECTVLRGRCTLMIGIFEGACARYGIVPLVEHAPGSCTNDGDPKCIYRITW